MADTTEKKPVSNLVWVDPDEFNDVLDAIGETIQQIDEWAEGESGHVLQTGRDRLQSALRVFRPKSTETVQ